MYIYRLYAYICTSHLYIYTCVFIYVYIYVYIYVIHVLSPFMSSVATHYNTLQHTAAHDIISDYMYIIHIYIIGDNMYIIYIYMMSSLRVSYLYIYTCMNMYIRIYEPPTSTYIPTYSYTYI